MWNLLDELYLHPTHFICWSHLEKMRGPLVYWIHDQHRIRCGSTEHCCVVRRDCVATHSNLCQGGKSCAVEPCTRRRQYEEPHARSAVRNLQTNG